MTQPPLFDLALHEKVAALFMDKPAGTWIDGLEIAKVGGAYGWRSRVSDCRRLLGMRIDNRVRRVGRRAISEYAWIKESKS